MNALFAVPALLAACLISGCTTELAYGTGQAWQRNQCAKLPDTAEFDRCMNRTQATYESYKQEVKARQR